MSTFNRATPQETREVLQKLMKNYSLEDIASKLGKSFGTLWRWQHLKDTPDRANYTALKELLK